MSDTTTDADIRHYKLQPGENRVTRGYGQVEEAGKQLEIAVASVDYQ